MRFYFVSFFLMFANSAFAGPSSRPSFFDMRELRRLQRPPSIELVKKVLGQEKDQWAQLQVQNLSFGDLPQLVQIEVKALTQEGSQTLVPEKLAQLRFLLITQGDESLIYVGSANADSTPLTSGLVFDLEGRRAQRKNKLLDQSDLALSEETSKFFNGRPSPLQSFERGPRQFGQIDQVEGEIVRPQEDAEFGDLLH